MLIHYTAVKNNPELTSVHTLALLSCVKPFRASVPLQSEVVVAPVPFTIAVRNKCSHRRYTGPS